MKNAIGTILSLAPWYEKNVKKKKKNATAKVLPFPLSNRVIPIRRNNNANGDSVANRERKNAQGLIKKMNAAIREMLLFWKIVCTKK